MNLADALTNPPQRNVKTRRCLFGKYIDSLDPDAAGALDAALGDYAWTNKTLQDRLSAEATEPRWYGSPSLLSKHRAGDCACKRGAA